MALFVMKLFRRLAQPTLVAGIPSYLPPKVKSSGQEVFLSETRYLAVTAKVFLWYRAEFVSVLCAHYQQEILHIVHHGFMSYDIKALSVAMLHKSM